MDKRIPVVVIKEIGETDKILTALKNYGIECAEITFRTAFAAEAIAYACEKYPEMNIASTQNNARLLLKQVRNLSLVLGFRRRWRKFAGFAAYRTILVA